MDFFVLLAALRARIALFALVLATTLVGAVVLSLMLPKTFRATASLMLDESVRGSALPDRGAFLQTQADILTSENVGRRVVDALHLTDNAKAKAAYASKPRSGSFEDWLVTKWLAVPKINLGQSNIIRLSIDAPDAALAAAIANAYARAYVDLARDMRTVNSGRAEAVLDDRLATLRSDLKQAQDRLIEYQRRNGIVSADPGADPKEARLADLNAQLSKAREQNLEQSSRQQQFRQFRDKGAPLDRLHEVQMDPQVQRLNAELQQGEARLQELAQQYGTAYPPYQRQVTENERRRAALDAQMNKVLAAIENAAVQSRWRAAELESELASQRSRLLAAKPGRGELATLVHNVESAQRTYDMAVQGFVIDMVGNEVYRSQVSLLSPATLPLEPHSPRIVLLLAGGAVAGILLGVGLVAMLEMLDRRVRTVADLRRLLPDQPVPMLGETSRWNPPKQALSARPKARSMLTLQPR